MDEPAFQVAVAVLPEESLTAPVSETDNVCVCACACLLQLQLQLQLQLWLCLRQGKVGRSTGSRRALRGSPSCWEPGGPPGPVRHPARRASEAVQAGEGLLQLGL